MEEKVDTEDISSPYGPFLSLPEYLTEAPNSHVPQEGIHLYQYGMSYYCHHPRQLFEETGVKYSLHDINLSLNEQYKSSYIQINPFCTVPTFIQDGKVTTNSENIMTKFTKDLAPNLIPADEEIKSSMNLWLKEVQKLNIQALTYGDVPGFPKPWWFQNVSKLSNPSKKKEVLQKLVTKHEYDSNNFLLHVYRSNLQEACEEERNLNSEATAAFASVIDLLDKLELHLLSLNNNDEEGVEDEDYYLCSKNYLLVDLYYGIFFRWLCMLGIVPIYFGALMKI